MEENRTMIHVSLTPEEVNAIVVYVAAGATHDEATEHVTEKANEEDLISALHQMGVSDQDIYEITVTGSYL